MYESGSVFIDGPSILTVVFTTHLIVKDLFGHGRSIISMTEYDQGRRRIRKRKDANLKERERKKRGKRSLALGVYGMGTRV